MRPFIFVMSAAAMITAVPLIAAERPSASADHPAITVNGCMQEGSSQHDYILTHLNQPAIAVGASAAAHPAVVERDELQDARNAYRLEPKKGLHLDRLVGHQVRVSGNLAEPAHLPANVPAAANGNPLRIKESELATVNVTSAKEIRNSCGGAQANNAR